jgi:hypothetical protein
MPLPVFEDEFRAIIRIYSDHPNPRFPNRHQRQHCRMNVAALAVNHTHSLCLIIGLKGKGADQWCHIFQVMSIQRELQAVGD